MSEVTKSTKSDERTFVSSPPVINQLRAISNQLFAAFGSDWNEKTNVLALLEKEFGGKFARDMWWLGHRVGLCAQTLERVEFLLGQHTVEQDGEWMRYQEKEEV